MSSLAWDAPSHVDEPGLAAGDADVFSRVATNGQPVIVRRAGEDLAAVVPLQYLELVQDAVARQKAEQILATLDWDRLVKNSPPPQEWFDGDEPVEVVPIPPAAASQAEPYRDFILRLAGSFGDEPFERPPQGDNEQREEW